MTEEELKLELVKRKTVQEIIKYGGKTNNPTAFYIAGQPGSGKSAVVDDIKKNLIKKGYPIVLDSDDIRKYHPNYEKVMKESPEKAYEILDGWGKEVAAEVVKYAKENKRSIIFDGTFGGQNVNFLFNSAKEMKKAGFHTKVVALSVNESYTKIGIHYREQKQFQKTGVGRNVEQSYHDMVYNNIPKNLNGAIDMGCFDSYNLYVRDINNNHSKIWKIYSDKKQGYTFLKDFINERSKPLTEKQMDSLENYKKNTIKLFKGNEVDNLEKKIINFNTYINESISKNFVVKINKQELPLTEEEQKLVAAIHSADMQLLVNNTKPLSSNLIKEICLSEKLNDTTKIMGLTLLKIEDAAKILDKTVKENSITHKITRKEENKLNNIQKQKR